MDSDAAVHPGQPGAQSAAPGAAADAAVTALYQAHALGLIRLAYLMLGDTAAAEDVVQEAFTGLYRRWAQLSDPAKALPYVRSSVLNASRSQLRHLGARPPGPGRTAGRC
jgi:DNA-directed RNA polymerase specialized sigma24 family protein